MLSINPYAANSWGSASSLAGVTAAKTIEGSGAVTEVGAGETSSVSHLARQLSEAAARAAVRDASMSTAQLAAKARSLEIALAEYNNRGAFKYSSDKPQTDDPELVARAQQASDYAHRRGANPFAGLSRDQLALIMYDEGDAFTTDERLAALEEYGRQRYLWSQQVCTQGQMEMQSTGTYINFFKACIAEYQAGSPIEQATYPPNYAAARQRWIDYWESGHGSGDMSKDFWEVMLRSLPTPKAYSESLSWGLTSRLSSASPETSLH
ncbi:MAG: hypothetical protein LBB76_02245 [Azoarcus sp.]|jgi:hypothetical protein|nr:hypothetical protein [Azoarcus sp.]